MSYYFVCIGSAFVCKIKQGGNIVVNERKGKEGREKEVIGVVNAK